MILILIYALMISTLPISLLLNDSSSYASLLHSFCHKILPAISIEKESLEALVCAKKITDQNLNFLLGISGLIHIFVVSGAQLNLLKKTLAFLKFPKFIQVPFLFLYTSLLNWQAPLLRGLSEVLLSYSHFNPKNIPLRKLIAGSVLLMLFPNLILSRSLVMSWVAALCSSGFSNNENSFKSAFKNQLLMYFSMAPILFGFAPLHPISILCNLLLAPAIAMIIFPLAVYVCVFPNLCFLFDGSIYLLRKFLEQLAGFGNIPKAEPLDLIWCWIYLAALQGFFYFKNFLKARRLN